MDRCSMKRASLVFATLLLTCLPAAAASFIETPFFAERVQRGELPPIAARLPKEPLTVDLVAKGRSIGKPGVDVATIVVWARYIRYMSLPSYAQLAGYNEKLELEPDILASLENESDQVF